mmetsp:Transcript_16208/g.18776  ORF Transcript_16208/g.18776 Transcript_16208/m.18776 type:complete len:356 (-) Transcript_16208:309-1376(-)
MPPCIIKDCGTSTLIDLKDAESDENKHKEDRIDSNDEDEAEEGGLNKGGKSNSVGRRGDPRMNRAVAARMANPELSLLEALTMGGFKFPDGTEGDGKSDRNVYDHENVLLCQRKNQLSRRIRLTKKRRKQSQFENEVVLSNLNQIKYRKSPVSDAAQMLLMNSCDTSSPVSLNDIGVGLRTSLKRSNDGQGLSCLQQGSSSRFKSSQESTSLEQQGQNDHISTIAYQLRQQQDATMKVALLQQQGLNTVHSPSFFTGNHTLQIQPQHPLFATQFPLNLAPSASNAPAASPAASNIQNNLNLYLELAATSMGLGREQFQSSWLSQQREGLSTNGINQNISQAATSIGVGREQFQNL